LYGFNYNLWLEIIEEVAEFHAPLFEAMHRAADDIQISRALIEDLLLKGAREMDIDPWHFLLRIDLLQDRIDGFRITLLATEEMALFEQVKAGTAADHGISLEDVEGFEIEHGLEMDEDIFEEIKESYDVEAEISGNAILFRLVVFDSQDIDNNRRSNEAWRQ
jgi:hypothetical protein